MMRRQEGEGGHSRAVAATFASTVVGAATAVVGVVVAAHCGQYCLVDFSLFVRFLEAREETYQRSQQDSIL
jgi:hypothetical protein